MPAHCTFCMGLCGREMKNPSAANNPPGYRPLWLCRPHYNDVIMGRIASQITSLTIVYSTVYSDADQRKHNSSASLAFVRWIHRGPVNSPHKWPVTRTMFPFDDVIMICYAMGLVNNTGNSGGKMWKHMPYTTRQAKSAWNKESHRNR